MQKAFFSVHFSSVVKLCAPSLIFQEGRRGYGFKDIPFFGGTYCEIAKNGQEGGR